MFISTDFTYDGISSEAMGVKLVNVDNNAMTKMPFGYKRSIIEDKLKSKDTPYFYGFEKEPLTLNITIAKVDEEDMEWTYNERLKIIEWFFQDDYKPFISMDNPEVIYYCTPIGDAERYDNSFLQGYVTLTLRCNSPYAYSPTYIDIYDHTTAISNVIYLSNVSNVRKVYYPEIEIEMVNDTEVTITNMTSGAAPFKITNLDIGEVIYINNQTKQIRSSLPNKYRLGNFNKNWLGLIKGVNSIQIDGEVNVGFRCSYPVAI